MPESQAPQQQKPLCLSQLPQVLQDPDKKKPRPDDVTLVEVSRVISKEAAGCSGTCLAPPAPPGQWLRVAQQAFRGGVDKAHWQDVQVAA